MGVRINWNFSCKSLRDIECSRVVYTKLSCLGILFCSSCLFIIVCLHIKWAMSQRVSKFSRLLSSWYTAKCSRIRSLSETLLNFIHDGNCPVEWSESKCWWHSQNRRAPTHDIDGGEQVTAIKCKCGRSMLGPANLPLRTYQLVGIQLKLALA